MSLGLSPVAIFLIASVIQPIFLFAAIFGVAALFRRRDVAPNIAIGAALVILATASLIVYWLEWWRIHTRSLAVLSELASILTLMGLAGVAIWRQQWRDEIAAPIALALFATVVLLMWTYAGPGLAPSPLQIAAIRWTHPLPSDNSIPLQNARAIADGYVPNGQPSLYFGDWLSSDRPPLQTALFFLTPGHLSRASKSEEIYQPTAVALQMFVLLAAWTLSRSLGGNQRLALLTMIGVLLTPLLIVNGSFVWPKLLAASFLLIAASIHLSPTFFEVRHKMAIGALVGALGSLAMLSHGASAFALVGMVVASLVTQRVGSRRYVVGGVLAFAALYAPWLAYQKLVDPPADRLLKWFLAGVIAVDPRPFLQTLVESYRAQSWEQIMLVRESNIAMLLDPGRATIAGTIDAIRLSVQGDLAAAGDVLRKVRSLQFYLLVPGSGVLGLGLYCLPILLFDRKLRSTVLAIIATLAFWVLILFLPNYAAIHVGSMFSEIALIVVTLIFAARLSKKLALACVVLQVTLTTFQYVL